MFVRFRDTARRLQASLVETRRANGRVRHSHIASLGSIPFAPSPAERIAFWTQLHARLARLANRIDSAALGAILAAIHARIPTPTQAEQQAERLAMAKGDARQRRAMADLHKDKLEGHKQLVASVQRQMPRMEADTAAAMADAEAADEHLLAIERGEDAPVSRPLTFGQLLKSLGWTASDARHARRMSKIEELGGDELLMDEIMKRHRQGEKAASRALLQRLLHEQRNKRGIS
jgi:hypothetical protein